MRHLLRSLCLCGALVSVGSLASAQQFSGSYGTSGGSYSGYAPQRKDVDNVGEDGQFIFAIERVTALNFDRLKISYTDEATGNDVDDSYKTTTLSLLGVDSSSPSQLPRFALDYVVASGFTLGGSIMFVTRSLSQDVDSELVDVPTAVRQDGSTFLIGGRAGYAFPFDETFGIWPRAGLSYALSTASYNGVDKEGNPGEVNVKTHYFDLNLEVLAVISPVEHIAIMAGPYLDVGLGGKHRVEVNSDEDPYNANLTSFGLVIHAGGYY